MRVNTLRALLTLAANTFFSMAEIKKSFFANTNKFFLKKNFNECSDFFQFWFPTEEAMFSRKILFSTYWCQSTQSETSRNVIFSWLPNVCVCACVCVCVRFSTFETPITHKRLEISIWNLLRQWSNQNPLIVTIFMTIDARFVILWDFGFKKKKDVVALTFVRFELSF